MHPHTQKHMHAITISEKIRTMNLKKSGVGPGSAIGERGPIIK